jgi:hypothetical protein
MRKNNTTVDYSINSLLDPDDTAVTVVVLFSLSLPVPRSPGLLELTDENSFQDGGSTV